MPNIATVLKGEITRLARKEAKAQLAGLKKSNAQYRRDIAELKRRLAEIQRLVSGLEGRERTSRTSRKQAASSSDSTALRFSAARLKSHREKLELSAEDYATLVGVSSQTIYNWEHGRARPRQQQLEALAAVRGIGKREAWRRLEE